MTAGAAKVVPARHWAVATLVAVPTILPSVIWTTTMAVVRVDVCYEIVVVQDNSFNGRSTHAGCTSGRPSGRVLLLCVQAAVVFMLRSRYARLGVEDSLRQCGHVYL